MLIYDIEIISCIPNRKEPNDPSLTYCAGWHDHANMGISCIGVYDYYSDRYRVFLRDNFKEFLSLLATHEVVVGFNNIGFDNRVIIETLTSPRDVVRENLTKYLETASYDILAEIWKSLGLDSTKFYWGTHGGYGLDEMCKANFRTMKSGNGALAPVLWQQGKIGAVIDYCLNDVKLTRDLLNRIVFDGKLKNPKMEGKFLEIRKPPL